MAKKRPFYIKAFTDDTISQFNENEEHLYKRKIESIYHRTITGTAAYLYQDIETWNIDYSANSTQGVARTWAFSQNKNTVICVHATTRNPEFVASVTDITNSHVTVTVNAMRLNSTASLASLAATYVNWSAITTACIGVMISVIGSNP